MELRPSEVYYSQDSILNRFGDYTSHGDTYLGETLDQLLKGYCNVNSIPTISVVKRHGKWFTSDNRRLWVFRKAEELGFLETIEVNVTYYLNENKFTTENGGTSIRVRGRGPGGSLWKAWKPKRQNSGFGRSGYNLNRNDMISPTTTRPTSSLSQQTTTSRIKSPVSQQSTNIYNQHYTPATRTVVTPRQDNTSSYFGSTRTSSNTNMYDVPSHNLPKLTTNNTPSSVFSGPNRDEDDTFRFKSSAETRRAMPPASGMNYARHSNRETLNSTPRQDRVMSPTTGRTQTRHGYTEDFHDAWNQERIVSPSSGYSHTRHNDTEKQNCCCTIL